MSFWKLRHLISLATAALSTLRVLVHACRKSQLYRCISLVLVLWSTPAIWGGSGLMVTLNNLQYQCAPCNTPVGFNHAAVQLVEYLRSNQGLRLLGFESVSIHIEGAHHYSTCGAQIWVICKGSVSAKIVCTRCSSHNIFRRHMSVL